ncbi:hypothetical protein [Streptomyces griseoruber]|uniref:Uncharacterized protein n=1 Tax=Streptomyces griseoruber TaxID=1943 RepID=A0A101SU52_9ACTN|nr:hypothetical protein [Streptomyces griseoruber]KUN80102.1 hypothetical protein AQJ64_27215 [Streptomyces griseoruber]
MNTRGHGKFRFAAVSVLVVLALTGFSTGKSRHHSSHGDSDGSGGGGCSSSSQDHDGSSSTSGGSGSGSTTVQDMQAAEVELLDCATKTEPYATVRVFNPNSGGATFTVTVDFLDADSHRVEERTASEYVAGNDTTTVRVALSDPALTAKIDHCEPEAYAPMS